MDSTHHQMLEKVRRQTPRYLFRAWGSYSGGDSRLNTIHAITPMAFLQNIGHERVYDLTYPQFREMAHKHIATLKDFATEFSSWSHSLSWVLGYNGVLGGTEYISVIDARELRQSNPAFHVSLLPAYCHRPEPLYPMEFLVHGIIHGRWLRAVPISAFRSLPLQWHPIKQTLLWQEGPYRMTPELVSKFRFVGELYGKKFAIPVILALISLATANQKRVKKIEQTEWEVIKAGLNGLNVPPWWAADQYHADDIVHTEDFQDTIQFARLMKYCIKFAYEQFVQRDESMSEEDSRISEEEEDDEEDDSEDDDDESDEEGDDKSSPNLPLQNVLRPRKSKILKRKSNRPITRLFVKEQRHRKVEWVLRTLRIEMNRHGMEANNNQNENEEIVAQLDAMDISEL